MQKIFQFRIHYISITPPFLTQLMAQAILTKFFLSFSFFMKSRKILTIGKNFSTLNINTVAIDIDCEIDKIFRYLKVIVSSYSC